MGSGVVIVSSLLYEYRGSSLLFRDFCHKEPALLHLFVDTNIFLSFYAFTNDDIEELRKVTGLIKVEKLKLYLPAQVRDEFYRNRDARLAESLREFGKTISAPGIPRYMADYPETFEYRSASDNFQKAQQRLLSRAKTAAEQKELAADTLFEQLKSAATIIPLDEATMAAAERRLRLGNPPGKPGNFGDRLNWEILLASVEHGTNLHIVSKTGTLAPLWHPVAPPIGFLPTSGVSARKGACICTPNSDHF